MGASRVASLAIACLVCLVGFGASAHAANAPQASSLSKLRSQVAAHPDSAKARLELARALVAVKRLPEALAALGPSPTSQDAVLLRAKILLWSGALSDAERVLLDAPAEVRESFDARLCLADVLITGGHLLDAKRHVDALLVQNPDHPDARSLKERILKQLLEAPALSPLLALQYRAEWRALETQPEVVRPLEMALIQALEKLEPAQRFSGFAAVESAWPRSKARELCLLEVERRLGMQVEAFQRVERLLSDEPGNAEFATMAGDLACAAAWSRLAAKDPQGARQVATTKVLITKPICLLSALGQAELILGHFEQAESVYAALRARDPKNTDILFGAAQATLALNKIEAADAVLRLLETFPTVDKERLNGLRIDFDLRAANDALQRYRAAQAEGYARDGLKRAPKSVDAALLLGAALQNLKRPKEAQDVLLQASSKNPRSSRILAARARLPGKADHVALARKAVELTPPTASTAERLDTELSVGDALVLDKQLDEAAMHFQGIIDRDRSRQAPQLRLAQVWMRQGDYFRARRELEASLRQERSFDATLSLADANHALNMERNAFQLGREALLLKPGQPDAVGFIDRLGFAHAPVVGFQVLHSWDNGTNRAWEYVAKGSKDMNPDLRVSAEVRRRRVETEVPEAKAELWSVRGGFRYQIGPRVALNGALGASFAQPEHGAGVFLPLGLARADLRVGTSHRLSIGYQADTFSYTAGMVQDHLAIHILQATGNGPLVSKLSFYTSVSGSVLNDGNGRGIAFGSIYSDIFSQPTFKAGVNGQYLGFTQNTVRSYFSPSRLVNTEVFAELLQDDVEAKFLYGALAALGYQKIQDLDWQQTYRFTAQAGGRPHRNLKLLGTAQISNSATTNIAGFSYFELGLVAELTLF
jgi:thioredoxin-like negative regulator of GroEL